jgi:hypothetical protein
VLKRRAILEREASGLVYAKGALGDMQQALATNGGVRPTTELSPDSAQRSRDVSTALDGIEHQVADLESAHAPPAELAPIRKELGDLKSALAAGAVPSGSAEPGGAATSVDLADLLRADAASAVPLERRISAARNELSGQELSLAKDALHRLDLRLSRLLRRARLGRIESVLGRKRGLEVEVEAIRLGYLPQDAVDSLDAARYLEDNEEYWPFEGDDWPDEYVGGETTRK